MRPGMLGVSVACFLLAIALGLALVKQGQINTRYEQQLQGLEEDGYRGGPFEYPDSNDNDEAVDDASNWS